MRHVYAHVEIYDHEEMVSVEALINDTFPADFATGRMFVRGNMLFWQTQLTGKLVSGLKGLRSFVNPPFAARRLALRVERVANA